MKDPNALITVCDHCFNACCWQGTFMCDHARGAGTVQKTIAELRRLRDSGEIFNEEHEDYWLTDDELTNISDEQSKKLHFY